MTMSVEFVFKDFRPLETRSETNIRTRTDKLLAPHSALEFCPKLSICPMSYYLRPITIMGKAGTAKNEVALPHAMVTIFGDRYVPSLSG